MGFLIKFLKELNSANSSKFITLAILLGLISGFLPTFNLINIIILFVVFIFRIPIGLYTASTAVFAFIGYLLDPLFHFTGLYLLQNSILEPIWTFLYNVPFIRWTNFNNSIVMGSLFYSIIFVAVLYFILNKSIEKYREIAFPKLAKNKYLKWIVPEEKKVSIFRMSGLIGFIVIFGGIFAITIFIINPLLKFSLEYSLSKATKKPVYIKSVDLSLFNLSLDIKDINIGKINIKDIYTKLDFDKLIWKKYDIKILKITDIKTNQSIEDILNKKTQQSNKSYHFKLPQIDANPKNLLASNQLETTKAIEKLKKDYNSFKKELESYNQIIKNKHKQIDNIKSQIKDLQKLSNNIKTPSDIENILSKVKSIKKNIDTLSTDIKTKKDRLKYMKNVISNDIKNIKIASNKDYKNLAKKYDMLKNGNYLEFTKSILKPEFSKYISTAQKIFDFVKPYLHKDEKPKYVRGKGVFVKFEDKIKYPDFVLEEANSNLITKHSKFNLIAKNISSNQILLAKEGLVKLNGKSHIFESCMLKATYLNEIKSNGYIKNLKLNTLNLSNITLIKPIINFNYKLMYDKNISLNFYSYINDKKVIYNDNSKMGKIISNVLSNINRFKIDGVYQNNDLKISSDLDKIISKSLNKLLQDKINKNKAKLKQLLAKKADIKGIDLSMIDKVNIDFNHLDNSISSLKTELAKYGKKELQKKLKNQIGNKLKHLLF